MTTFFLVWIFVETILDTIVRCFGNVQDTLCGGVDLYYLNEHVCLLVYLPGYLSASIIQTHHDREKGQRCAGPIPIGFTPLFHVFCSKLDLRRFAESTIAAIPLFLAPPTIIILVEVIVEAVSATSVALRQ
jgi:hypothetical protein